MVGIFTDYNLNRQQAVGVLKACIKQHADTPDTPNWYLKHQLDPDDAVAYRNLDEAIEA